MVLQSLVKLVHCADLQKARIANPCWMLVGKRSPCLIQVRMPSSDHHKYS